ncbi:imidazole glycerol phosphate synthase subunit HisH [Parasegetibacter sp. NRK P23]|uniref:imidazole glycerol phosphate synthase subunit HisH n=1 Tax=Parasegetibacter sp. NRK P23 TaxID=2942999 RepID=UPI002043BEC7|nr:imidazole glycerol phosphate synthase subunit HisH [Parasegetibacter sp. NRK P23]MCM5530672.1 imidazole glycerol phosphate synthase subunit HisH [Parasegetibacter sp. NRK P23]
MKLAIVKYNAGNIQSVLYAMDRIGVSAEVTDDPEMIRSADKVLFPGVGEASTAMNYLKERKLDELIISLKQPVLGICLGMQLMCRHSTENDTDCLGIFDVDVKRFQPAEGASEKVPQIGWNALYDLKTPLFEGLDNDAYVYFVHSYYAAQSPYTIASTNYVLPYSAALHRDNFYGVQFHPEKSADVGQKILENFIKRI